MAPLLPPPRPQPVHPPSPAARHPPKTSPRLPAIPLPQQFEMWRGKSEGFGKVVRSPVTILGSAATADSLARAPTMEKTTEKVSDKESARLQAKIVAALLPPVVDEYLQRGTVG